MPESREVKVKAKDIINYLAVIIRTGHFHTLENVAVQNAIVKFIELMNPLIEKEDSVRIDLIGEFFYINDSRVKYPIEFLLNFDFLIREFRRRELGTVSFVSPLKKDDMKEFLRIFLNAPY